MYLNLGRAVPTMCYIAGTWYSLSFATDWTAVWGQKLATAGINIRGSLNRAAAKWIRSGSIRLLVLLVPLIQ